MNLLAYYNYSFTIIKSKTTTVEVGTRITCMDTVTDTVMDTVKK